MTRVTAGEFQKEFGRFRSVAHREAVTITNHGRDDLVLLSAEEYQRLKSRDRQALHVSQLTEDELNEIAHAEIPAEAAQFNHEMD